MKVLQNPGARRRLRQFFFLLGLLLFALLIYRLNPRDLWQHLQTIGYKFIFILLVSFLCYLFYSWAWEIFLKGLSKRVRYGDILKIKIVGEAVNFITPLSWGGGDPVRILLLKDHIPVNEGTASVVVDRTLNNLAVALFMLIGVFFTFLNFTLPPSLEIGLPLGLAVILLGSAFLYVRAHEGLFQFFLDLAVKLRLKKSFSEATLKNVAEIDGHISRFYKMNKAGFVAAFGLHFLGRLCAVAEIYLAAWFLGQALTWTESYLLASMTVLVNMIFVFVPGGIGVLEGAFAGIFAVMHRDPAVGGAIQIVRRLRMVFWIVVGLILMAMLKKQGMNSDGEKANQNISGHP